jgi:7-keto-8-aminopelargonate synthetase-like enzyme
MARGYFVNVAMYPAVARRRAGVRLMLTARQTLADIANLVGEMAHLLASPPNPRSGGPKSAEGAAI